MNKITSDMIEEWEAESLLDARGNCIELNEDFLSQYCGEEFTKLMKQIPERDRELVLSGLEEKHWFNGFPAGNDTQDIWLNVSEIEYQFEGDSNDVFENPQDFTIHGDLAYLYVGYGFSIEYNREKLQEAVKDYLETYK